MRIGVFCSGGDAPGMNACVRAVVRAGVESGHEVVGIMRGYEGLLNEDFYVNRHGRAVLTPDCVHHWNRYGGAFLRSSRSERFRTPDGQQVAARLLEKHNIDALVPIGGDGTFTGAIELGKYYRGQIVGCPGTIDNDLQGTDYTIGFSTAVNTAVEAIDRIRDTAESHERMFLVEVMGRHSGYIAAFSALASGAEVVAVPETRTDFGKIVHLLKRLKDRGRSSAMVVVAEGDEAGGAAELDEYLKQHGCPFSSRIIVLGHLQRGGSPTPEDRWHATMMGAEAVNAINDGATGIMIGTQSDTPCRVPLTKAIDGHRAIPSHLIDMLEQIALD